VGGRRAAAALKGREGRRYLPDAGNGRLVVPGPRCKSMTCSSPCCH
jgi:hypothetical protein